MTISEIEALKAKISELETALQEAESKEKEARAETALGIVGRFASLASEANLDHLSHIDEEDEDEFIKALSYEADTVVHVSRIINRKGYMTRINFADSSPYLNPDSDYYLIRVAVPVSYFQN